MQQRDLWCFLTLAAAALGGCASTKPATPPPDPDRVELGNFSVSLLVKDVGASRRFYEALGFKALPQFTSRNMSILKSGHATVGLFQRGVERTTLTFNPGWDRDGAPLASFQDIREIQKTLQARGLKPTVETDPAGKGPAFIVLTDPDGNPVVIDQHVPSPAK